MNLYDENAERSTIGSVILNNDAFDVVVAAGLKADDFGQAANRQVFAAIEEMVQVGQAIDLVTLRNKVKSEGKLEAIGGVTYLSALTDAVPAVSNVKYYAEIVLERSRARKLYYAMVVAKTQLEQSGKASDTSTILSDVLEATLPQITLDEGMIGSLLSRGIGLSKAASYPWGWRDLDRKTGGIPEGALTVIGAYPGVGKTALATSMMTKLARNNVPVVLFSTEMSAAQIIQTILGRESGVGPSYLRSRGIEGLDGNALERLTETKQEIEQLPLYILAGPVSATEAIAHTRALIRKHDIKLIVIDYLQLMTRAAKEENRRIGIDNAIRAMQGFAQSSGTSVVLLSQLSRDKGELKESGGIDAEANQILKLDRPNFRKLEPCPHCSGPGDVHCQHCRGDGEVSLDTEMVVRIEKNRFGDAGCSVGLGWDGRLMQVTDWQGE